MSKKEKEVESLKIKAKKPSLKNKNQTHKVDLNKVDIFYTTPAYYDYNWTINNVDPVFGAGTKEKVKEALLSIGNDKKEIMELFQTDKFIESKNENYDAISSVAKKLNIIK